MPARRLAHLTLGRGSWMQRRAMLPGGHRSQGSRQSSRSGPSSSCSGIPDAHSPGPRLAGAAAGSDSKARGEVVHPRSRSRAVSEPATELGDHSSSGPAPPVLDYTAFKI
ncbi:tsukushin isoform X2 [Alligator sinensis]|uniref:Tsukushin isoform X2 n=1 Tax=Alligator sinensis TaxID=38654 RepID=A0A3Q0GEE3_ALLSI|nr:tsukushin isoform X2 [Alligator sinensis]